MNEAAMILPAPDLSAVKPDTGLLTRTFNSLYHSLTYEMPVAVCKRFIDYFLKRAVQNGRLQLKLNDGTIMSYGDGTPCGIVKEPVTIRVFEPWFFVKTALEYDLGLAR
jgi:cyclopropane-fatty-acyl-phospholipid synthase